MVSFLLSCTVGRQRLFTLLLSCHFVEDICHHENVHTSHQSHKFFPFSFRTLLGQNGGLALEREFAAKTFATKGTTLTRFVFAL